MNKLFMDYYDDIFPVQEQTVEFLLQNFEKGKTLDFECATGEYALALSRRGYDVLGIDPSPYMVNVALEKNKRLSLLARFNKGYFTDVVYQNQFQNLFAIDNFLDSVSDEVELKFAFKYFHNAMVDGGTFILEVVNYDLLDEKDSIPFHKVSTNKIQMKSSIKKIEGRTIYAAEIEEKGKKEEFQMDVYPARSKEIIDLLQSVGFKNIKTYGDFDSKKFDAKKSLCLVIVAKK